MPIAVAILFCLSSGVFSWGENEAAMTIGTPDLPAPMAILGWVGLVFEPWLLLFGIFIRGKILTVPMVGAFEAISACLLAFGFYQLRRWRRVYNVLLTVAIAVSSLYLYFGIRDMRRAAHANKAYEETFGKEL